MKASEIAAFAEQQMKNGAEGLYVDWGPFYLAKALCSESPGTNPFDLLDDGRYPQSFFKVLTMPELADLIASNIQRLRLKGVIVVPPTRPAQDNP